MNFSLHNNILYVYKLHDIEIFNCDICGQVYHTEEYFVNLFWHLIKRNFITFVCSFLWSRLFNFWFLALDLYHVYCVWPNVPMGHEYLFAVTNIHIQPLFLKSLSSKYLSHNTFIINMTDLYFILLACWKRFDYTRHNS